MLLLAPLLDGCESDYVPRPIDTGGPPTTTHPVTDRDADGWSPADGDCNDLDPTSYPGAHEECDGKDNDCDGLVDQIGDSLYACAREDRLQQTMQADVLLVLNNSTRMQAEGYWDRAADGSYEMATHLIGPGDDTHIGVVLDDLTDPQYSGRLVAPNQFQDLWIEGEADTPVEEASVEHQARLFLDGMSDRDDASDAMPKGMRRAVQYAIDPSHEGNWNQGFFRPSSTLFALVMFTDVDDTLAPPSDADLLNFLTGLNKPLDHIRVYAVTQTSGYDCDHKRVNEAVSIVSLVQQTHGFSASLCPDDWTGFMSSVGQDIAKQSLQSEFVLSSPPRLDDTFAITIKTQDSGSYLWNGSYAIEGSSTLVFPDSRPPAGSWITVDYFEDWARSE